MAALEMPNAAGSIPPRVIEEDPDRTGTWWPPATLLPGSTPDAAPSAAVDWALEPPTGHTIDLFGPQEMTCLEEEESGFEKEITQIEALPSGITLPPLPIIHKVARASLNHEPVPAEALVRKPSTPASAAQIAPGQPAARVNSMTWMGVLAVAVAVGYWLLG